MNVTLHFHFEEFACKDGTPYPEDWITDRLLPLAKDLEKIRERIKKPLLITSAYRTPEHKKDVIGATNSYHV